MVGCSLIPRCPAATKAILRGDYSMPEWPISCHFSIPCFSVNPPSANAGRLKRRKSWCKGKWWLSATAFSFASACVLPRLPRLSFASLSLLQHTYVHACLLRYEARCEPGVLMRRRRTHPRGRSEKEYCAHTVDTWSHRRSKQKTTHAPSSSPSYFFFSCPSTPMDALRA